MDFLAAENAKLREELAAARAGSSNSSWSEVSREGTGRRTEGRMPQSAEPRKSEGVTPCEKTPKNEKFDYDEKPGARYTPGGTEVPAGEPPREETIPLPPPPTWVMAEWDMYQRQEQVKRQWMGDRPWSPVGLKSNKREMLGIRQARIRQE